MAIAVPFALDVKAFSEGYGEPRSSVNAVFIADTTSQGGTRFLAGNPGSVCRLRRAASRRYIPLRRRESVF
jgi:hypothetical protein